jgi:hypothetical protein
MKVNVNRRDVLTILQKNLSDKTPFLLTRFGEGEIRMFRNNHESDWIIKTMFGYIPDTETMDIIRNNMEMALINSDITGLPTYKDSLDEESVLQSPIDPIYKETYQRFRSIFEKNSKSIEDYQYCDVNVHTQFNGSDLFTKLLQNLNELTIITCRDISPLLKSHFNIKKIIHYKIPPEHRFEDNPNNVEWNFFPKVHTEIKNQILSQDNHGKLCLYGAGLAGKDLGLYFKQSGGVAFDIGSIFDLWIGKQTRGKGKGRNIYFKSPLL